MEVGSNLTNNIVKEGDKNLKGNFGQEIARFSPILKSLLKYHILKKAKSCSGTEVLFDLRMTSLSCLFQKTMRISYAFHTNLKIKKSQFLSLLCLNLSNISHTSRKTITVSEYVIKFLNYLSEVVNFDPFGDATNLNL